MAVRVFRLEQPVTLPMRAEFGGCKSWVDIGTTIGTAGAQQVLAESNFEEKLRRFHAALEPAAV
jgi:hypothetical protein